MSGKLEHILNINIEAAEFYLTHKQRLWSRGGFGIGFLWDTKSRNFWDIFEKSQNTKYQMISFINFFGIFISKFFLDWDFFREMNDPTKKQQSAEVAFGRK